MSAADTAGMEMVTVDDGVRLRTWTTGRRTGLPPVVLLHGGPGLWDYLEPVARLLEPLTVVHRFDQRGCGGSDPSADHTMARYVADIEALRRHWGHEDWAVVGHSFGATLAYAYALAEPERTRALGYLGGTGLGDWRGPARAEAARRMTPDQRQRLTELQERPDRTLDEEVEFRALCWFTDHADRDRAWEWARQDARAGHPINWAANRALMAPGGVDLRPPEVPCWFIHGDGDPRPVHTVAALAATVPGAELHLIAGAGHHPWRERPAELAAVLGALIRRAARATGAAAAPVAGRGPGPDRASPPPATGRSDPAAG
jgi:proline iminopeptidase